MAKLRIREITDEPEWHSLFERASQKQMTQSWAFGEAKRAENWRPRRIVITKDNEPVAIGQVLCKDIARIPAASRLYLGPLILRGHENESETIYRAVRNHWRYLFRGPLLIAPALHLNDENVRMLGRVGFRSRNKPGWTSSRLNLTESEATLRAALDSKWRNQLKKAERAGTQIRLSSTPQDIAWIIDRHAEHLAQKQFKGAAHPVLVRALRKASPEDFNVFIASFEGDNVGGIVVYRFADEAHYYVGWNGPEGRRLYAGNLLLWTAIMDLKAKGCARFDLGGHDLAGISGFAAFKLGLNAERYETAGEFLCF